jgi:hypothetical protein
MLGTPCTRVDAYEGRLTFRQCCFEQVYTSTTDYSSRMSLWFLVTFNCCARRGPNLAGLALVILDAHRLPD